MNKKISSFEKIKKELPLLATLVSGSFEPFNEYYYRFLKWSSNLNRPLVVIVQKDNMVKKRRGFESLSTTHKTRSEIISSLEFVDLVFVSNRTSHDEKILKILKPKIVALQNDNTNYRETISEYIANITNKKTKAKICPFSYDAFTQKNNNHKNDKHCSKFITKKLKDLSKKSTANISKISCILTDHKNKIIFEATNSSKEEHAEILVLKHIKNNKIDPKNCLLYILIPPCLMCAKHIVKSGIKKVFYSFPYGDNIGIAYLIKNGVSVKKTTKNIIFK